MSEQQRFHRIAFSADAELYIGDKIWYTHIHDLSLHGALIDIPDECTLQENTQGALSFHLSDVDIIITMEFIVKNIFKRKAGVAIEHIDIDSMSHLKRLIELNTGDDTVLKRELHELVELHIQEDD